MITHVVHAAALLALIWTADVSASPLPGFVKGQCQLVPHFDVSRYIGKNFNVLPRLVTANPPDGMIPSHLSWEVYREQFADEISFTRAMSAIGADAGTFDAVGFSSYKGQILEIRIYFREARDALDILRIDQVLSSCGRRVSNTCSINGSQIEIVDLAPEYKNAVAIRYGFTYKRMFRYPDRFDSGRPCTVSLHPAK